MSRDNGRGRLNGYGDASGGNGLRRDCCDVGTIRSKFSKSPAIGMQNLTYLTVMLVVPGAVDTIVVLCVIVDGL